MTYKNVLIHIDRGPRSGERLDLGLGIAQAFGAHCVGMFALSAMRIPSYARAEASAIIAEAEAKFRAEAEQAGEAVFRGAVSRSGYTLAEWRASKRDALGAALLSARYSDLVVVGQREEGAEEMTGIAPEFVDELVLAAGRPVLVIPYAGRFPSVGKNVLVAWNASREAGRAVTDAIPLLQRADSVQVVAFDPGKGGADHGDVPGADIGLFLARHGVKVQVAQQNGAGLDIGAQILSRAADVGADLIVMGAYGHSRIRELVLGGATRTLLESMTVPVLLSH
jgi:nucleotide-binding universal stress UspA family protein